MKMKLTTLLFGLLLAVGWTNCAQAQQLAKVKNAVTQAPSSKTTTVANGQQDLNDPFALPFMMQKDVIDFTKVTPLNGKAKPVARAPKRSAADATASATRTRAEMQQITYDWVDANGNPHNGVAITEPASNPYQIAYLLGTTYMNKDIPGTKYSTVWNVDVPYNNVYYGWDIPANSRWGYYTATAGTNYADLVISLPSSNILIYSITVTANGRTIASWNGNNAYNNNELLTMTSDGNTYYLYSFASQDWSFSSYVFATAVSTGSWPFGTTYRVGYCATPGNIIIPASQLNGNSSITVTINAVSRTDGQTIYVNDVPKTITTSFANYSWTINGANSAPVVTPPDDAGYTVFLVKVKDEVSGAPQTTWTWNGNNSVINFFDTYIDEVQLLTDGTRLNEGTDDAGTMFSYSGELNRFYFIGKGKNFLWGDYDNSYNYAPDALAPTYQMYEEFSPTSTESGDETTDFYSKLLYGNSYNVIHDCRAMCNFEHYFSMSGKNGTDHKSMTNLVFWIPDNRGKEGDRNYDEEYLPHVGLYTIVLEAEAEPAADYSANNRMYDVTLDWVSSLDNILDFDVDQDYELWVYIYDENGNPVKKEKLIEHLQDQVVHNETTYTYQVPQEKESYTIYYRVHGWPKDAKNTPGYYPDDPELGYFYALSNIDPVLIPGYENFLALGMDHYESDFLIAEEHNYYRNFLSLDNQNPNNALTAKRIEDGEDQFTLYRFDGDEPSVLTKAADLSFAVDGNNVNYLIKYHNQFYVDDADQSGISTELTGYKNVDALGYPTSGTIATISDGSSSGGQTTETKTWSWNGETDGTTLPTGWSLTDPDNTGFNANDDGTYYIGIAEGTTPERSITIPASVFDGISPVTVSIVAREDAGTVGTITVGGVTKELTETLDTYTWENVSTTNGIVIAPNRGYVGFASITITGTTTVNTDGLLNNFLDNSTYTQVGMVVFPLPWKSINVKLQDESAGTSAGYFMIQSGGRLRFIMPAGFNNASLRFVVHNAPVSSNYYDGTFTLKSSTGETHTIEIPSGGTSVNGDRDYEVIFTGISSNDVITITGTHTVNGTTYTYSPDFKYIHVYVEGGHDGISKNDALNLAAIKFVDQFKAETKEDKHPYRYGYVLKYEGTTPQESAKPEVPVQHAGASLDGYYTLKEIQEDTKTPLLQVNVMNAEVLYNLTKNPQVYYYTLERKPSTAAEDVSYEEISKMQKREDDSYMEMDDKLGDAETVFSTALAPRFDNYNVQIGSYNDYMSYVPVVWTHGELPANRRVKWDSEKRHNSYGAPIWKTGVAEVKLTSVKAERQDKSASTTWTYGGEDCNLYMLTDITAEAKMPTVNNVKYVPYMFRIFVKSNNSKLRGYQWFDEGEGTDPNKPGSHYEGAAIDDPTLQCVWSSYVNDPLNEDYGVTFSTKDNVITFHKDKVASYGTTEYNNAIFAGLNNIIQGTGDNMRIDEDDLTVVVRFYYIVEGFDTSAPTLRAGGAGPAGYGAEGEGFTPGPATGIYELINNGVVESVTYVNAQGMQSDKPFDGLNIVITRYSNGTTRTTKVIR